MNEQKPEKEKGRALSPASAWAAGAAAEEAAGAGPPGATQYYLKINTINDD